MLIKPIGVLIWIFFFFDTLGTRLATDDLSSNAETIHATVVSVGHNNIKWAIF